MEANHAAKNDINELIVILNSVRPKPLVGAFNAVALICSLIVAGYGVYGFVQDPTRYVYWICMILMPVILVNVLSESMSLLTYYRVGNALKREQPSLEAVRAVLDAKMISGLGWGTNKALGDYLHNSHN
jgi:hypothetical protein